MNCGNKTLLATGITGLIGKELIEPLQKLGFEIHGITIDENNPNNGVIWHKGNLFDANFINSIMNEVKPQYLLNMAWATTGDYLSSDINYDFLCAGINLIKAFAKNGGKRAVYAGTCFEYDFIDEKIKENTPLAPEKTAYTFCKNKLHEICEYYCKKNDISFGWGRIFYVYGKNEAKTRLTGMVIDKLSNNEEVIIKSGKLIKDYMYAKDISGAFAKFLDSDVVGEVNICTSNPVSIEEYTRTLAQILKKENLLVFKDEPSGQPLRIVGDNTRLIQEVGYKIQYNLKDALKEIVNE